MSARAEQSAGELHQRITVLTAKLQAEEKLRGQLRAIAEAAQEEVQRLRQLVPPPKPTGKSELDPRLLVPSPAFMAEVEALPPDWWARYDLSAVRLGWELHRAALATRVRGWIAKPSAPRLRDFLTELEAVP